MPSIRVKRSYARLEDIPADPSEADGDLQKSFTLQPTSPRRRRGTIASLYQENTPIIQRPISEQGGELSEYSPRRSLNAPASTSDPSRLSPYTIPETAPPPVELLIPNRPQAGLAQDRDSTQSEDEHHDDQTVDTLAAIDPEIAAISNLSDCANSIFIPPLGIWDRRPTIVLPQRPDTGVWNDTEANQTDRTQGKDYDELDDHVDDVINRRDVIRRSLRGLLKFIKTPQGACTAIYGFLVAFWGAAIVFFLGKLINLHNPDRQGFWVEVSSQIENGLFTVTGVGFIPWRVIDTYRIVKIWHYKRLTRKLRKQAGLPALVDEDDLPDPAYDPNYVHVLSDKQQEELHYQQVRFGKSQTFYRPHGTSTHRAFPINTALLICCLIDGNSLFQCILCGCMWGLNRFQRPAWTTGTLIPASFLCGIAAAVLIWRGGQRTRRTKAVEKRFKAALEFEKQTGLPAGITATAAAEGLAEEEKPHLPLKQNDRT